MPSLVVRKYDKSTEKYSWKFSKFFTGKKQTWTVPTKKNSLFLSTAVQFNNEQLIPVFSWFQKDLIVIPALAELSWHKSIEHLKTKKGKQRILKYINVADSSISDISLAIENFSEDKLPKNLPENFKEMLKTKLNGKEMTKLEFIHASKTQLNYLDESHGTQKFFALAGYWLEALESSKVIVIDELNNSLHPLAVKFLIELISDPKTNKKNSQLIFSTHDTALLDSDIFRRDQVWFVEKDKHHATQLYPLLDFSPRKDEAIGKGYLRGRYGALPYVGVLYA